jgi:hypothetical protein
MQEEGAKRRDRRLDAKAEAGVVRRHPCPDLPTPRAARSRRAAQRPIAMLASPAPAPAAVGTSGSPRALPRSRPCAGCLPLPPLHSPLPPLAAPTRLPPAGGRPHAAAADRWPLLQAAPQCRAARGARARRRPHSLERRTGGGKNRGCGPSTKCTRPAPCAQSWLSRSCSRGCLHFALSSCCSAANAPHNSTRAA